jgi:hypothetical protein
VVRVAVRLLGPVVDAPDQPTVQEQVAPLAQRDRGPVGAAWGREPTQRGRRRTPTGVRLLLSRVGIWAVGRLRWLRARAPNTATA